MLPHILPHILPNQLLEIETLPTSQSRSWGLQSLYVEGGGGYSDGCHALFICIVISLRPRELCLGSRLVKSNPNCTRKLTRADELGKVSLIVIFVYILDIIIWLSWGSCWSCISWYTWDHQLVILIISPKIKVTCRNSPAESSVARCPYIVWKTFCCRVVWWDIKRSKNHRNCERCLSISYSPGLKCHLDLYCPEGIE